MLYFSEMLRRRANGLETLRQRATCPVCQEFYTTPKRLDCSHVFCLDCLTRHLQAHSDINFPPCPMCRRPIRKSYSEVSTLEPARAEEEIVDFVKQFEVCGLCKQNDNPSVKCFDCEFLLCDDCCKCDDMVKPCHRIVSITSFDEINQYSNLECTQHGNHMNKFCIMCEQPLCVLCDWFEHEICKRTWDDHDVQEKYKNDFLTHFIHCINLKKWCTTHTKLPRLVNLHEVSLIGRHWEMSDKREIMKRLTMTNKDEKDKCDKTVPTHTYSANDISKLQEIFKWERVLEARERNLERTSALLEYTLKFLASVICGLWLNTVTITSHKSIPLQLLEVYVFLLQMLLIRNGGVILTNDGEDFFRLSLNLKKYKGRSFIRAFQIMITFFYMF